MCSSEQWWFSVSRAVVQAVSRRPLTTKAGIDTRPLHVRLIVDKVTLKQVLARVLPFPLSVSFHQSPHNVAFTNWTKGRILATVKKKGGDTVLEIGERWKEKHLRFFVFFHFLEG